jgi:hypothetical protein
MVAGPWETVQMVNGSYVVMKGDGWTVCDLMGGKKAPCRPSGKN